MSDRRQARKLSRRPEQVTAGSDKATDDRFETRRRDEDFENRLDKTIEDNRRVLDRLAG
jgi:hypothetical protein